MSVAIANTDLTTDASMATPDTLIVNAPADQTLDADTMGCLARVVLDTAELILCDTCPLLSVTTTTPVGVLPSNGGRVNLPLGRNRIIYEAVDTCGNVGLDSMFVTVTDPPPVAICSGQRIAALGSNGMALVPAEAFDGGSFDLCQSQLYFKARRIPDADSACATATNPDFLFDDVVKLCCEDLFADSIVIILRVYDSFPGNGVIPMDTLLGEFTECTTSVVIQDKIPPVLTCPDDITIECGDHIDFDTLPPPIVEDNCDSVTLEITIERDIDQCGVGEFRRVIIATDAGGQMDTCVQTIFVINSNPFNGNDTNDLKWPEPFVMVYDCIFVPDTSVSGGPVVMDDECSMVSVSWEDEVYKFSRDACSKVIRTFRVVDWCQYDPKVDARCIPDNGCWTFEQIIKVVDTIPPTITHPADTIVDYLKPDCDRMYVSLDSATTDTCFFGEMVELGFEIDHFRDGMVDSSGSNGDASGMYPIGKHWVIYIAKDECANTTFDTLNIEIKDRVLPSPIAMTNIRAALVDMGGGNVMTTVNANQINASSYDNCTNTDNLLFSFSTTVTDTVRTFTCDDVPSASVEFWVTDECGNQNKVDLNILIQDTGGFCPDSIGGANVSGLIARHDGMELQDIEVALYDQGQMTMFSTDVDGNYNIDDLPINQAYTIEPKEGKDAIDGISTKDMVLIQRHLLGLEPFELPYQYLGADTDGSGHVSTSDIADIRKLILGIKPELKCGKQWQFMPNDWTFDDPTNPWKNPWPTDYRISNLQKAMNVNFKGFRIGDVDMSYVGLNQTTTRGNEEYILNLNVIQNGHVTLNTGKELWLNGLQMAVSLVGYQGEELAVSSELEGFGPTNYNLDKDNGVLYVSWMPVESMWLAQDAELLSIVSESEDANLTVNLSHFRSAELYTDEMETYKLKIASQSTDEAWLDLNMIPNPFNETTTIQTFSESEQMVRVIVRDIIGAQSGYLEVILEKGWNNIELDAGYFPHQGIFIVEVSSEGARAETKVIKTQ